MFTQSFLITFCALFVIIAARYFAVAGLFYWLLWGRDPQHVLAMRLSKVPPSRGDMLHEIKWSLISSLIFAFPGAIVIEAWKAGGTALYGDIGKFGLWYVPVSVLVYLFLHDTYFYWTHRIMHHPKLFARMHRTHHMSRNPTPWAAFSFHPWESALGAVFLPAVVFFVPLHVGAALFILVLMTVASVLNHTGWEIFPKSWMRGPLGQHVITAMHHDLHHHNYKVNFGLYFRFWDKLMGTDVMESAYPDLHPEAEKAKVAGSLPNR
jgi:sterol desaturase/sphingolipid hydroxylase (fatty acid hydroxylase superfamily)